MISYNYWLSTRDDLLLGVETIASPHIISLNNKENQNKISVIVPLKDTTNPSTYTALVFLNGLRYNSTLITP
jgi:hypothetical protein